MTRVFPPTRWARWLAALACAACVLPSWAPAQAQQRPLIAADTVIAVWHPADGTPGPLGVVEYVPSAEDDPATAARRVTVFFNRAGVPSAWRAEWEGHVQIHVPAYGTVTVTSEDYTEDELREQQAHYDDAIELLARIEHQLRASGGADDSGEQD